MRCSLPVSPPLRVHVSPASHRPSPTLNPLPPHFFFLLLSLPSRRRLNTRTSTCLKTMLPIIQCPLLSYTRRFTPRQQDNAMLTPSPSSSPPPLLLPPPPSHLPIPSPCFSSSAIYSSFCFLSKSLSLSPPFFLYLHFLPSFPLPCPPFFSLFLFLLSPLIFFPFSLVPSTLPSPPLSSPFTFPLSFLCIFPSLFLSLLFSLPLLLFTFIPSLYLCPFVSLSTATQLFSQSVSQ